MRRALLVAGFFLGACGGAPDAPRAPPIAAGLTCPGDGYTIEVGADLPTSCAQALTAVRFYRNLYEGQWGAVDLAGWTVRVVSLAGAPTPGGQIRAGETEWDVRRLTIVLDWIQVLPHELHHIALGPDSYDHHGWCADFEPWERATLALDERTYLGCTAPTTMQIP